MTRKITPKNPTDPTAASVADSAIPRTPMPIGPYSHHPSVTFSVAAVAMFTNTQPTRPPAYKAPVNTRVKQ